MQNFDKWLKSLDELFIQKLGLGYLDFPDFDWYSYFEDEAIPEEAFNDYCENEGIELE